MKLIKHFNVLASVILKNFRRMIRSKVSFGMIFLGPFIILLLLQSAYNTQNKLDLDIGISSNMNNYFVDNFIQKLSDNFNIYSFDNYDVCVQKLKIDKVDICIDITNKSDKVGLSFYVDYSKLTLVSRVLAFLSDELNQQTDELQLLMMTELVKKIEDASNVVANFSEQYRINMLDNSSLSLWVSEINIRLENVSGIVVSSRNLIDDYKVIASERYTTTQDLLIHFKHNLEDVSEDANDQQNEIKNINEYYDECDTTYLDQLLNNESLSESEFEDTLEEFGKCKCVDFYRPKLLRVEKDMGKLKEYADDAAKDISITRTQNKQLFDMTIQSLDTHKENLNKFRHEESMLVYAMQKFNRTYYDQLYDFKERIDNLVSKSTNLGVNAKIIGEKSTNPVIVSINPISATDDLLIYVFPYVYFFILMFISLIFSSTYTFSEKNSLGKSRNVLSPLNIYTENLGLYISLLIILLFQSALIILLANLLLGISINLFMFGEMILLTIIIVSLFILLGLIIGYLFNSQLIVMLMSITITILLFLYSSIINPIEMMPKLAQKIIEVNPYVIGANALSKTLLFKLPLNMFLESFRPVAIWFILIILLLIIIIRRED